MRSSPMLYRAAADELRGNAGQWQAYESSGHCVVLAGPGSGKTKVLTIKMARMLAEDVRSPRGVACLTYNAECARALTHKLPLLGVRPGREAFVGTVHAFCLKNVLGPFGSQVESSLPRDLIVAGNATQELWLQRALDETLDRQEIARYFRTSFDRYRRTHLNRGSARWRGDDEELALVIEHYERLLHAQGLIDFDDMVLGSLQIVRENEWVGRALAAMFPILLIDEYQDLGRPLHRLVGLLKEHHGVRIFAVGDADQSIYGFTGAEPRLLTQLADADDVETVRLKLNYRSRKAIVDGARIVIQEDRGYEAVDDTQGLIDFVECPDGLVQQAATIVNEIVPRALQDGSRSMNDIAVIYPDRKVGDAIAEAVVAQGWSFVRFDQGAPYPKTPFSRWLEGCAAWCAGGWETAGHLLADLTTGWLELRGERRPSRTWEARIDLVRFLWSHREPDAPVDEWLSEFHDSTLQSHVGADGDRQDDAETWRKIVAATRADGSLPDYTVREFGRQAGHADQLSLITLHSCKGLEFQVVIMMGLDQGVIPRWNAGESERQEQRRLFYVGLTRAKHEVHMLYSGYTVDARGWKHHEGPSEFVEHLRQELEEIT